MTGRNRPIYLQIRDEIVARILDGRPPVHSPLPSVRSLACAWRANPLTVAKAYQGLREEGVVVVRRGVGLFAAEDAADRLRRTERERFLNEQWPDIMGRIRRLGFRPEELFDERSADV